MLVVRGQTICGAQGSAKNLLLTHTGCAVGSRLVAKTTTISSDNDIEVFPNPSVDYFRIQLKNNNNNGIAKIYTTTGQLLKSFSINNRTSMDFGSEFKPGVYLLEISIGSDVKKIKLIKSK